MKEELKKDKTQFFMNIVQNDITENHLTKFFEKSKLISQTR